MILTKTLSKKDNIENSSGSIQIEKVDLVNFKRLGQIIEKLITKLKQFSFSVYTRQLFNDIGFLFGKK